MAIPQKKIREWKEKYGTIFRGGEGIYEYCFRPLTVSEFIALTTDISDDPAQQVEIEDSIVEACLLYPSVDEYGSWPVGLAANLVEVILSNSGWGTEEDIAKRFASYKGSLQTYLSQFKIMIIAAEMGYSWEELDKKSVDQIIELAAAANEIIQIKAMVSQGSPPQIDLGGDLPTSPGEDPIARKLHEAARRAGI